RRELGAVHVIDLDVGGLEHAMRAVLVGAGLVATGELDGHGAALPPFAGDALRERDLTASRGGSPTSSRSRSGVSRDALAALSHMSPKSHQAAVLLVHGIGEQRRGDTLQEFGGTLVDPARQWVGVQ